MKSILEHYNLLIAMTILTSLAILLKCVCAISYQMLFREIEQIGSTENAWLKSMLTKFESCYQLKLPMHHPESFVKVQWERYRLAGIPIRTLEQFDLFAGCITTGGALLTIMGGIYYRLPTDWIVIQGITLVLFLFFLGISELLFQTRRKRALLQAKLENYFSNTLHPKLVQQYLFPEMLQADQEKYFEPREGREMLPVTASTEEPPKKASMPTHSVTPDMQELIDSLLEESKLTEELEKKKQELTTAAAREKLMLVEEIMKEYIQI